MDKETRTVTLSGLEVRTQDGKARLEGYAVRFDTMSEDLGGFRERIAPGAFSANLRSDPDVRALVEHNAEKIIGRTRAGTLRLIEDDAGVKVEIDPPQTRAGQDVVESVRRGDLSSMSFGFRALSDSWSTVDGESVRTINEAELFDVSVVAFPAYPDATIGMRSMDRWKKELVMSETVTTNDTPVQTAVIEVPENEARTAPEAETVSAPEQRTAAARPATTPERRNPSEWRNCNSGKSVRVLKPEDRFSNAESEPLSLGRAVRAMIVGDWSSAPAEQRALSTTSNPSAGILVPSSLAASVIDKARAKSVLIQAGAKTVAMDTGAMTIARVATDPSFEVHTENVAFTASDIVLDSVVLTSFTIGSLTKMSRELAADAPNAVGLIENVLASSLAAQLDFFGLQGTGTGQPLGLTNISGTGTVAITGAADYDDILSGISLVEIANHAPNAVVMSPSNIDRLRKLKRNAEVNNYASAPAAVASLKTFSTTNTPDTTIAVGDFSKYLIGLRQGAMIEVSTQAGSSFEEHAVYIKITWRGAFSTEHANAFTLLTGIV